MTKFAKALLKLKRAKEAIDRFEEASRRFFLNNSYDVITDLSPSKTEKIWSFRLKNTDISELSADVDDILSNLRDSLDNAIADIAFAHAGRRDRAYFAMGKDKDAFEKQLKEKSKDVPEKTRNVIEVLQPYGGGSGSLLWQMHLMNIDAKHRGLHIADLSGGMQLTTLAVFNGFAYILGNRYGQHLVTGDFKPKIHPFAMTQDIEFLTTSPEAYYRGDPKPTFNLVLDGLGTAHEALREMHAAVVDAVDKLGG